MEVPVSTPLLHLWGEGRLHALSPPKMTGRHRAFGWEHITLDKANERIRHVVHESLQRDSKILDTDDDLKMDFDAIVWFTKGRRPANVRGVLKNQTCVVR